jgi:hypothetical protein
MKKIVSIVGARSCSLQHEDAGGAEPDGGEQFVDVVVLPDGQRRAKS